MIKERLYDLAPSSERFHSHLAYTLRSFGFEPTRYDNDVLIRLDDSELCYEYMCTHVGDFMIISKNPDVKEDSKVPLDYYLGNNYKRDSQGRWCIGCQKYLKEALIQVETVLGIKLLKRDRDLLRLETILKKTNLKYWTIKIIESIKYSLERRID